MTAQLDEDAVIAAVDLVGRTGATELEFGHLHDDVPVAEADWYASAKYRGARVTVEHETHPVRALEGLARRLLDGGKCIHCGRLVTLFDEGVTLYPGASYTDGSGAPSEAEVRRTGGCRWRRVGRRWERGCERDGRNPRGGERSEERAERKRVKARRKRGRR